MMRVLIVEDQEKLRRNLQQLLVNEGYATYDVEGNRTLRTNNATGAHTTYAWGQRNRLKQVREHDAQDALQHTISHKHDTQNRWTERNVASIVIRFV